MGLQAVPLVKGWSGWVIEPRSVLDSFVVSDGGRQRGGSGGSLQPLFSEGHGVAQLERNFCRLALASMEARFPTIRKPEHGPHASSAAGSYKEALLGCASHALSNSKEGRLFHTTSCKGGTGEDNVGF